MIIKKLGIREYSSVYEKMISFTTNRSISTEDELWVLEHYPVFTLGKAGKKEHILKLDNNIPIINTDRGGQVTYHGPGQLIVYLLIDFNKRKISIRELINRIENSIINTLYKEYGLAVYNDFKRPGIYIDKKKIASLGLRIFKGSVYHGLSLNVNMDLSPFLMINPCGYDDLKMTQLSDYINPCPSLDDVANILIENLKNKL